LVKIFPNEGLPQRDPIREEFILALSIVVNFTQKNISFHTFPLLCLFGARISGAGMGGRVMAALIPSPAIGV
jgi:hypothetical protein